MRLGWLSDIHLDHCETAVISDLISSINWSCEAVVITGDISHAGWVIPHIELLDKHVGATYFVLGNHDFYGCESVSDHVERVQQAALRGKRALYLPGADFVRLSEKTALIGVNGWGDMRLGNPMTTTVQLADFSLIPGLYDPDPAKRMTFLQKLADADARLLRESLREALQYRDHVIVATHVPPFAGAAWHEGKRSDPNWLPYFACKATGDVILEVAREFPTRKITVLCGHTHSGGVFWPGGVGNVEVKTAEAKYGHPALQGVLEV